MIRLISLYEKDVKSINSYKCFKKFKVEKSQLISFVESWQKYWNYDKYTFSKILYKTRKRIIYSVCLWLCVGICCITIIWERSHSGRGFICRMSKTLHPISYSIGDKLIIISAIALIITFIISKIANRKYYKEMTTNISFDTYKDHIRYIKNKLKETPWQEVNLNLKRMKDAGVEFPAGYNFKV